MSDRNEIILNYIYENDGHGIFVKDSNLNLIYGNGILRTQENRAKVVLAEAEVPLAMAQAFREGNLGILDYYRMKNIQADTGMRDSISKSGGSDGGSR